jgi:hypothetical protein
MPKGNSIYDIYFGAESDPGKYEASKFGIQDIWSGFEHRDKMTKVKQENIANVVDSLQASIELGSTLYQGHLDRLQFESDLSTVSGGQDAIEVGSKGQKWEDMNLWERMRSGGKQYQIGDKTYTKSDITVTAGVMKGDDLLEKTSLYDEQETPKPEDEPKKQSQADVDPGTGDNELTLLQEAEAETGAGSEELEGDDRTQLIKEMGFQLSNWGESGPTTHYAGAEQKDNMKKFMNQMQQLGYDVGDIDDDWNKYGSRAWGKKSKTSYGQVYQEWQNLYN